MTPADQLNTTLQKDNPVVFSLLSERGRRAFFPHSGILGQSAEAKGKTYNATIGIALEEDGSPMRLGCSEEEIGYHSKDVYPYASSFGKPELRSLWKEMMYRKNPDLTARITNPVVTSALTHGLSVAGYLFLDAGDELIVPDLHWGNYALTFAQQFDVQLTAIPTFKNEGLDIDSLHKALHEGEPRKRVVLLNFPNNPTGYTPTKDEAVTICEVLLSSAKAGNRLVVLLDDAYFGLVYEDNVITESLFSALADLHEHILTVKIDGATKEDYAWGFRIGFLTYGTANMSAETAMALEDKTAGVVRGTISNCCHLSQTILIDTYKNPRYAIEKQEKYDLLKTRYEEVRRCLNDNTYDDRFSALPFNSGYFMCVKLIDELEPEAVRKRLLEVYDTGVIVAKGLIRIAYSSLRTADIAPLFANLHAACNDCMPVLTSVSSAPHESVCSL